jgi:hypothetical protein
MKSFFQKRAERKSREDALFDAFTAIKAEKRRLMAAMPIPETNEAFIDAPGEEIETWHFDTLLADILSAKGWPLLPEPGQDVALTRALFVLQVQHHEKNSLSFYMMLGDRTLKTDEGRAMKFLYDRAEDVIDASRALKLILPAHIEDKHKMFVHGRKPHGYGRNI